MASTVPLQCVEAGVAFRQALALSACMQANQSQGVGHPVRAASAERTVLAPGAQAGLWDHSCFGNTCCKRVGASSPLSLYCYLCLSPCMAHTACRRCPHKGGSGACGQMQRMPLRERPWTRAARLMRAAKHRTGRPCTTQPCSQGPIGLGRPPSP